MIWIIVVTNYLWFVWFTSYRNGVKEAIDEYKTSSRLQNDTNHIRNKARKVK